MRRCWSLLRDYSQLARLHSFQILPKLQDESELRRIESESAKFEQQNDSKWTDLLADDWVLTGNKKTLTKTELQRKGEAER